MPDNASMSLDIAYIKKRRQQLKLSQAQAAEAAGLPGRQKWSNFENGRIPNPQISSLEAIAKALKCGIEKLVK